jgi:hypothetical protein
MHTRVTKLDGSGNGSIGVPPCRWAGTQSGATFTKMDRTLTTGLLVPTDYQLADGTIEITGGDPDEQVRVFVDYS